MTAFVQVLDYGRQTRLVCRPCGLVEEYGTRYREAEVARAFHNAEAHPEEQR